VFDFIGEFSDRLAQSQLGAGLDDAKSRQVLWAVMSAAGLNH
jgi:hypothetical protein